MRITVMPSDVKETTKKSENFTGVYQYEFTCCLPWTELKVSSLLKGTAMLALWEAAKKECAERGIELVWRVVNSRTLRVRGEIFQLLYDKNENPMFADLVILEKRDDEKPGNIKHKRKLLSAGDDDDDKYQKSLFAVHLPYKDLPQPEGRSYHKGQPRVGDRYIFEFCTSFKNCSACGGFMTQGKPIFLINERQINSTWFMHYIPAAYGDNPISEYEVIEALEQLDLGRQADVSKRDLIESVTSKALIIDGHGY